MRLLKQGLIDVRVYLSSLLEETKMRKLAIVLALSSLGLAGCATGGSYQVYADTQRAIAEANARAEMARVQALSEIAKSGDTTAQVAAVITLNMGTTANSNQPNLQQPESLSNQMLKWASIIVPSAVQVYGIGKSSEIAITNSNNNRDIAVDNNRTSVNMGRLIAGQTVPESPVMVNPIVIQNQDGGQSVEFPQVVYPQ